MDTKTYRSIKGKAKTNLDAPYQVHGVTAKANELISLLVIIVVICEGQMHPVLHDFVFIYHADVFIAALQKPRTFLWYTYYYESARPKGN